MEEMHQLLQWNSFYWRRVVVIVKFILCVFVWFFSWVMRSSSSFDWRRGCGGGEESFRRSEKQKEVSSAEKLPLRPTSLFSPHQLMVAGCGRVVMNIDWINYKFNGRKVSEREKVHFRRRHSSNYLWQFFKSCLGKSLAVLCKREKNLIELYGVWSYDFQWAVTVAKKNRGLGNFQPRVAAVHAKRRTNDNF